MKIRKVQARGVDTRKRLLDVATALFSERGFDGVSTRDIAGQAGTTLPSIAHHFKSKEGLYGAVVSSILEEVTGHLATALASATNVLDTKNAARQEKLAALEDLLSAYARVILQSHPDWARLMVQEQLRPSSAITPINYMFEQQLVVPVEKLLSSLCATRPQRSNVRIQALTLLGRVLIFRMARESSLRVMGWDEFTPVRIEKIVAVLRSEVHCGLKGWLQRGPHKRASRR
jgi:AcrR family transcriptional regulator